LRIVLLVVTLAVLSLVVATRGDSHLVKTPDHPKRSVMENRHAQQSENLYHSRYVCRHGGGANRRWHCQAATGWLLREWRESRPRPKPWWIARQIEVAEILGRDGDNQGTDPWPNCPDPYDHRGHSWIDTLACESPTLFAKYGNTPKGWLDPKGFYRCGLQFDPGWEDRYGKLCP